MNKKILVVDDDPHIVSLIKTRFEANNYAVVTAADGEECIKKILSDKPDLVILDIMMPKVDGYSVLIGIKEIKGYLDGDYDLAEAERKMAQNSRRYAKRQLTWFRKDKRLQWLEIKSGETPETIANQIVKLLNC